ncbi:MAG: endonuclease III [Planctomycetia bacterium]|nr:endonuclease III [Planctomycetia bacterium]
MAVTAAAKQKAMAVASSLAALYPEAHCALNFHSPLQLLVATILSAQCTDVRVNIVTRDLFRRYRTAQDFADAPLADLEQAVRTTGFFRNKAKNIKACCCELVERYGGEVPQDLAALVVLAGVGRKTANVVLGTAFGIPSGVVVDTHVTRLTHRLGLTKQTDAVKIEKDLMQKLPPEEWIDFSHRLIWHGRLVCQSRKPRCEACVLAEICPKIGVAKPVLKVSKSKPKQSVKQRSPQSKRAAEARASVRNAEQSPGRFR